MNNYAHLMTTVHKITHYDLVLYTHRVWFVKVCVFFVLCSFSGRLRAFRNSVQLEKILSNSARKYFNFCAEK
jgi:hypothetical protein